MNNDKRKPDDRDPRHRHDPDDEKSKGQYGGLTDLGPGGGRDIKDAVEPEPEPTAEEAARERRKKAADPDR